MEQSGIRYLPISFCVIVTVLVLAKMVIVIAKATIESRAKGSRFFLSSLDRFLICELVFLILACKDVKKVLIYTTCFACFYTVFSTRILDDS